MDEDTGADPKAINRWESLLRNLLSQGVIENLPAFGRFPSIILYPMDMMEMS
jgi:hypothetical protein